MDHPIAYEKKPVPLADRCQAHDCGAEAGFIVTITGRDEVTKRLCSAHTGHSLSTALIFNLGHRSVRMSSVDQFREWL